jgi:hypothetical protein
VVGCFLQQNEREKGQSDRAYGMNHCGSVGRGRGYFCQAEIKEVVWVDSWEGGGYDWPAVHTFFARYKEASADVQ